MPPYTCGLAAIVLAGTTLVTGVLSGAEKMPLATEKPGIVRRIYSAYDGIGQAFVAAACCAAVAC